MTKRYAVKTGSQESKQNTRDAIANREPFQTSGALRGEGSDDGYYVYSYAEIIARYTRAEGWVVPTRKWSVTTTHHQSAVRQALHGTEYATPERW